MSEQGDQAYFCEGIAEEKGALYEALGRDHIAFLNADEPLLRGRLPRGVRRVSFGTRARSDVRITGVTLDRPQILLEANADGVGNWVMGGGGGAPAAGATTDRG